MSNPDTLLGICGLGYMVPVKRQRFDSEKPQQHSLVFLPEALLYRMTPFRMSLLARRVTLRKVRTSQLRPCAALRRRTKLLSWNHAPGGYCQFSQWLGAHLHEYMSQIRTCVKTVCDDITSWRKAAMQPLGMGLHAGKSVL